MTRIRSVLFWPLILLLIFVLCSYYSDNMGHNTNENILDNPFDLIVDDPGQKAEGFCILCGSSLGRYYAAMYNKCDIFCFECTKKFSLNDTSSHVFLTSNSVLENVTLGHWIHKLIPADCTSPAYCNVCGESFGLPLGHDIAESSCTKESHCLYCGEIFGEKTDHSWKVGVCDSPLECEICGFVSDSYFSHVYEETGKVEPTCEGEGSISYCCIYCNAQYTEPVSPTGHSFSDENICEICGYFRVPIDVPYISQYPLYPNGCESVCAVMALRYMGIDISIDEFIDDYLLKSPLCYYSLGADPEYYYIGDPRDSEGLYCFAPAIQNACEKAIGDTDNMRAIVTEGMSISELCDTYIDHGVPVIVWATKYMIGKLYYADAWWIINENGEKHQLLANLHCFLLTGYDEWYYYFNDPLVGQVKYSRYYSELSFSELGERAVVIINELQ